MEEDNEDCSPNLNDDAPAKQLIADRWELWKRKQNLFKKALSQAFHSLQDEVCKVEEQFNPLLSGSTLSCVLVTDDNVVYSANVGDSQTVLVSFDKMLKEEMRRRKE